MIKPVKVVNRIQRKRLSLLFYILRVTVEEMEFEGKVVLGPRDWGKDFVEEGPHKQCLK